MTKVTNVPSFGLPFNEEHAHFIATEPDGSKSIYCTNCYKDGKFITNITMEEIIRCLLSFLSKQWRRCSRRLSGATLLRLLALEKSIIFIINL